MFFKWVKKKKDLERSEEYYINKIIYIQKQCWKMNMNDNSIHKEVKRYLNKLYLSEDKHGFVINYRDKLNNLLRTDAIFNKHALDELNRSLFKHRDKLKSN